MYEMMRDLRLAVRQLRRSMTFTVAVILTLALGIGLNAAIFTMVDCVLLRPLGYHDADRIYGIDTRFLEEHRAIPVETIASRFRDTAGRGGPSSGSKVCRIPIATGLPRATQLARAATVRGLDRPSPERRAVHVRVVRITGIR